MTEINETPAYLFWCDLETSGLDPEKDVVLELAFVLTRFAYPYESFRRSTFLVKHDEADLEKRLVGNSFVYEMHKKSGLLIDLLRSSEKAPTLQEVEAELLDLSRNWPPPADEDPGVVFLKKAWETMAQAGLSGVAFESSAILEAEEAYRTARMYATDRRVVLAGSSAHFDKGFLRVHMPSFHKRLSHRIFDASAVSMACRSMGMPRLPKSDDGRSHRAEYDVLQSIEQMWACRQWLVREG